MTLTDLVEIPEDLERPQRAVKVRRRRHVRLRPLVLRLLALVAICAGLGMYAERVIVTAAPVDYLASDARGPWLQASNPSTVGWFRADPNLSSEPISAVLSIDGRDLYRVWVNGRVVATNRTPARAAARPTGVAVDVRPLLHAGRNVVAVQVSNLAQGNAALWANLQVRSADGSAAEFATAHSGWRATSDTALAAARLSAVPGFIQPGFSVSAWPAALLMPSVRAVRLPAPIQLLAAAPAPPALTALSAPGIDAVYVNDIATPPGTTDLWLRVAATGSLTVSADGRTVLTRPAPGYVSPNSHRPAPLSLVHITRRSGSSVHLIFHVTGQTSTALAVDGVIHTDGAWTPLGTDLQTWSASQMGVPIEPDRLDAAAAARIWPNGYAQTIAATGTRSPAWSWALLAGLLGLIVVGAGILVGRRRFALAPNAVVGAAILGTAPAGAAVLAVLALSRWTNLPTRLAYAPGAAAVVAAAVALPVLLLVSGTLLRGRISAPRRVLRVLATALSARRRTAAVVAIAVLAGQAQSWNLGRQPLWQDEATSIEVARAIKNHGLPHLDSGLYYFKGELYHALLAIVLSISDDTTVLRAVSVAWFVATVLAFGLLLMPTLTSRVGIQVAATAVLAIMPAEVAWARDVRMYQQMQFFVVVFAALLIRAITRGRTRDIVGSSVALVAMYLSHEESFILLPALPVVALLARNMVWQRRRVFLFAYLPAGLVIAVQYVLAHLHPPDFGEDLSNRTYVGWDPNQAEFYYQRVFFAPFAHAGSLAIVSTMALIGFVIAWRRQTPPALAGVLVIVGMTAASLIFTAKVDRYSFVAIPLLVALAVYGAAESATALRRLGSGLDRPAWVRGTVAATVVLAVMATLATLVISPRGFGLYAADATGAPNPLTHPDYQPTVDYVRTHQRPGDQVISLAPPVMVSTYLGRSPDRVIQTGRNKLLYLVLSRGKAVETILGVPVLLTGRELRIYLEAHPRVWLISDTGSYAQGVPPDVRAEVSADFTIVSQDAATTVSLWDTS